MTHRRKFSCVTGTASSMPSSRASANSLGPIAGTMQSTIEFGNVQFASIHSARSGSDARASRDPRCRHAAGTAAYIPGIREGASSGEQVTHQSPDSGLDPGTGHRPVRAIHATVAGFRLENRIATTAPVGLRTGGVGHVRGFGMTAFRTGDRRLDDRRAVRGRHHSVPCPCGDSARRMPPRTRHAVGRVAADRHRGAQGTTAVDVTSRISHPSPFPASRWCRAIANVTRYERVPACSPAGAAKPRPQ